jgi:hypothetical protein
MGPPRLDKNLDRSNLAHSDGRPRLASLRRYQCQHVTLAGSAYDSLRNPPTEQFRYRPARLRRATQQGDRVRRFIERSGS